MTDSTEPAVVLFRHKLTVSSESTGTCSGSVVCDIALRDTTDPDSETYVLLNDVVYCFGDSVYGKRFYRDILQSLAEECTGRRTSHAGDAMFPDPSMYFAETVPAEDYENHGVQVRDRIE